MQSLSAPYPASFTFDPPETVANWRPLQQPIGIDRPGLADSLQGIDADPDNAELPEHRRKAARSRREQARAAHQHECMHHGIGTHRVVARGIAP